jgi:hypothetical protein
MTKESGESPFHVTWHIMKTASGEVFGLFAYSIYSERVRGVGFSHGYDSSERKTARHDMGVALHAYGIPAEPDRKEQKLLRVFK